MFYLHYRNLNDYKDNVPVWGPWIDSSFGPYTDAQIAIEQVKKRNCKTREYRYGNAPVHNTDTTPVKQKVQAESKDKGVVIYKYQLPIAEHFELQMPEQTNILRVDDMNGTFWLWVLHDLRKPMRAYKFHMFRTGSIIPDSIASKLIGYAGFCKLHIQQELCLYVFMES